VLRQFWLKWKSIDWSVVLILICLMVFSTLLVHSAIQSQGPGYSGYTKRNVLIYAIGFVALFATSFVNYRLLVKGAVFFYVAGVASLVLVLRYGSNINGATGWFKVPGTDFYVQPAEVMKLVLILTVAWLLSKRRGEPLRLIKDVLPLLAVVFIPFALVMRQPDLGNAIIYLVIVTGMLWIGNIKYLHALIGIALIVASVVGGYYLYQTYHDEIYAFLEKRDSEHWVRRIDTFLYPDQVSSDDRHQIQNSLIAIGSGGLTGEGYLQGEYVHKRFVPLTYSDSIFVVVAEEFGFIGCSVLLLLYFLLIYRMIWIAIQCDHFSGAFLVVGIVSMFVFQAFQNIGMLLGIMPLTGITLPFISYGGSSLLINMASVGLVMSTRLYKEKPSAL
jgi:Bacterial cell division membrane protein